MTGVNTVCSIRRLRAEVDNQTLFDISAVNLKGRLCAIFGPSGIGKSIFLKGLANGEANVANGDVKFQKLISFNNAISNIRYIPQSPPRFNFSVKKFFDQILAANQDCIGCAETLNSVCKAFEISSVFNSRMTDISGGQLYRVHIAAALASKAELLLLDEPSAALDRNNVVILMRLLREFIEQRNGYIICCTHDTNFRWQCNLDESWNAFGFPTLEPLQESEHDKVFAT